MGIDKRLVHFRNLQHIERKLVYLQLLAPFLKLFAEFLIDRSLGLSYNRINKLNHYLFFALYGFDIVLVEIVDLRKND